MSTPRNDVDEWVLASAAEVARNVARHGVPITWSEAAERLRRTVELLSGPVFVIDDGGTFTPLPQQEIPLWQETGFAESVACAAVHYAGQPYYPENPRPRESSSRFPGTPQLRWCICSAHPWLRGSPATLPAATRNKLKRRSC